MNERRLLPNATLAPEDLSGLSVLVADDHANTARLIRDVLRAAGVGRVEVVHDGAQALETLRWSRPDLLFTDDQMPGLTGVELSGRIRKAAVFSDSRVPNPEIPIVMVTGHATAARVSTAQLAGVNEFVVKPFTPAALLSRIQLVLTRPRPFIRSAVYVGPDRRRKLAIDYSGPLRRTEDPVEVVDVDERRLARETIGYELEAMRKLISVRGGVDRATLQMTYRVMQHTRFRARQVRDPQLERASDSMLRYVDAMGGPEGCDPDVLDVHFDTLRTLLTTSLDDKVLAETVTRRLETLVDRRIEAHQAA